MALGVLSALAVMWGADEADVVAEGKGVRITRGELEGRVLAYHMKAAVTGEPKPRETREQNQRRLLNHMIHMRLLSVHSLPAERAAAYKSVKEKYEKMRKSYKSELAFEINIEARGVTTNQFRSRLYEEDLADKVIARMVTTPIQIPDSRIQKFYVENRNQWSDPDTARFRQMIFSGFDVDKQRPFSTAELARKKIAADGVLARLRRGEDFGKLAEVLSDNHQFPKPDKGIFTVYKGEGDSTLIALERAVFALKPNQVSPVVKTRLGYHIVQMLDFKPANTLPLSEVRADILKMFKRQETLKALPGFYGRLKKGAGVEITLN